MTEETRLAKIRQRIDQIDEQIQALINQRAAAAQEVARIKQASDGDPVFYRPEREAQVLRRVKARNQGPLDSEAMARIFREIMSACLALEQPMKVAFLGPEGTFTQAAALKHFGHAVAVFPFGAINDIFQEVEAGNCHYGVVPVENSTEGVISHTLDMFLHSPLKICGEVMLRIHHNLLSNAQGPEQVRRVYAHQQSLAQCRGWLDRHLPHAQRLPVASNAEAAQLAARSDDSAAVGSEAAAEIYGLGILAAHIEDEPQNTTRFLIIGHQPVPPSGEDKTSLLLSTRNESGGLVRLLEPLARHGVSMTRIESRPSRREMWDYVFFIDVQGHREEPRLRQALEELEARASLFKWLGSYPRAVL